MRIAIFGSGPAGLFAAHAAVGQGHEVQIFSQSRKSEITGAQYLRRPIPGLSGESFQIHQIMDGDPIGYLSKTGQLGESSVFEAWDIREAYDRAWDEYASLIREVSVEAIIPFYIWNWMDRAISTIPRHEWCDNPHHNFYSKSIFLADYVKLVGTRWEGDPDNQIVLSGFDDDWWYRQSRIHGHESTEFPVWNHPEKSVRQIMIPVGHDCDCNADIIFTGQQGSWDATKMADDAFYDIEGVEL